MQKIDEKKDKLLSAILDKGAELQLSSCELCTYLMELTVLITGLKYDDDQSKEAFLLDEFNKGIQKFNKALKKENQNGNK